MLNYKGYIGEAVYDDDLGMFAGRVVNARAVGTFYGKTVEELEEEFRKTVDYYFDLCQRKHVDPEKPFSGRFNLRVSPELHRKIYLAAREDEISINSWIAEGLEKLVGK